MEGGQLMEDLLLKRMKLRAAGAELMNGDEIRVLTWRVLKALEYMHCKKKIMHRDLKPENILMARLGSDKCGDPASAMVCDFGHSKILAKSTHTKNMGTVAYAAPEIIFSGKVWKLVFAQLWHVRAASLMPLAAAHDSLRRQAKGETKTKLATWWRATRFRRTCGRWASRCTSCWRKSFRAHPTLCLSSNPYLISLECASFDTADPADHAAVKLVRCVGDCELCWRA
jgi:serine/threonine protein kinase